MSIPIRLALALVALAGVARAQTSADVWRIVMKAGAACHSLPDSASPVGNRYRLASPIHSMVQQIATGGRTWYADAGQTRGSRLCWIDGAATLPYDWRTPDVGYAAVADSLLARPGTTFEMLAELIAKLEIRDPAGSAKPFIERYPLLAYKRLVLVDTAASTLRRAPYPYDLVWITAHQQLLGYSEPQGMYYVPGTLFRDLVEANMGAPWADDAAWTAATRNLGGDECSPSCYLNYIVRGPAQYWTRFPSGKHIAQSLADADKLMSGAFATMSEGPPTKAEINEVRTTLVKVAPPLKQKLLHSLDSLQRIKPPRRG